jgi:Holliday junction resolvase-like predicted endonuclease
VDARKKSNLRRACRAWLRIHSWSGGYRFDVVEVFGTPGTRAECDHIERVELFPVRGRFVRWA